MPVGAVDLLSRSGENDDIKAHVILRSRAEPHFYLDRKTHPGGGRHGKNPSVVSTPLGSAGGCCSALGVYGSSSNIGTQIACGQDSEDSLLEPKKKRNPRYHSLHLRYCPRLQLIQNKVLDGASLDTRTFGEIQETEKKKGSRVSLYSDI